MIEQQRYEELEEQLGVHYSPTATRFAVWSPEATKVKLVLYQEARIEGLENESGQELGKVIAMNRDKQGIWRTTVEGDQKDKYYNYLVERDNDIKYAVDPYAQAVSQNGTRGVIVDLDQTNPEGWEKDERPKLENPEDAIIYEMHVRDFSISPHSGMEHKGKFLAFTEEGTTISGTEIKTGLAHLKELGITHVHLLPVFDFASVDERYHYQYNWGYDPQNYNVPEGSYATDSADPVARIKEFKELVQALHQNGIRVIMDVVYNHTYGGAESNFGKLAPQYYYRNSEGRYSNGSGCGNEIASEHPMVRKFIIDSVLYWAQEYHIDGFRFDLMALHDQRTMRLIADKLHQIDPSILIYGEPWTAADTPLPATEQMTKGTQKELQIGVFNDNIRDSIKGSTRGRDRGFATGKLTNLADIKEGIIAGVESFAADPEEVINYVSAHDDLTLWDKIEKSTPEASAEDKIRMNNLCNAIVLTSQGIPFLHGGVELLRTKFGVENSYQSSDRINQIEWVSKLDVLDTFYYYQGLINLRKEHPAFRMTTAEQIKKNLEFLSTPKGLIGYQLKDYANGDSWKSIVVIYNPLIKECEVDLPQDGNWKVVVKGEQAGTKVLDTVTAGVVVVPKISTMVLYQ